MRETPWKLRKEPVQRRADATVKAITEGAARILEQGDRAKLSTNRIARAAGVSIGTLYQYFSDKRTVVAALSHESRAARVMALQRAVDETDGLPLEQALPQLVGAGLEPDLTRPTLAAALDREEDALALDGADEAFALERILSRFLARYYHGQSQAFARCAHELRATAERLAELAGEQGPADLELAVRKIARTLLALADASLVRRR